LLGGEPHEVGRFAEEQRIGQHDGGARTPPGHDAKGRLNLRGRARLHDIALELQRPRHLGDLLRPRRVRGVAGVRENRDPAESRHSLVQELHLLAGQLRSDEAEPRHVPSRPRQAGHQARGDRIGRNRHDDRHARGRLLRGERRCRARDDDHVDAGTNQLLDRRLRGLLARLGVSPLDDEVLVLRPPVLAQAVDERLPPHVGQ
jgi:hypothetical protein